MKCVIEGTHCVGKTALCQTLQRHIPNSIVLEEVASTLKQQGHRVGRGASEQTERLIFKAQIEREKELEQKYSVIILDRGLTSNFAYFNSNKHIHYDDFGFFHKWVKSYYYIFYIPLTEDMYLPDPDERRYQIEVDLWIQWILTDVDYKIKYYEISGNVGERVQKVLKVIRKHIKAPYAGKMGR